MNQVRCSWSASDTNRHLSYLLSVLFNASKQRGTDANCNLPGNAQSRSPMKSDFEMPMWPNFHGTLYAKHAIQKRRSVMLPKYFSIAWTTRTINMNGLRAKCCQMNTRTSNSFKTDKKSHASQYSVLLNHHNLTYTEQRSRRKQNSLKLCEALRSAVITIALKKTCSHNQEVCGVRLRNF